MSMQVRKSASVFFRNQPGLDEPPGDNAQDPSPGPRGPITHSTQTTSRSELKHQEFSEGR